MSLQEKLQSIAMTFAASILDAVQSVPLSEVAGEAAGAGRAREHMSNGTSRVHEAPPSRRGDVRHSASQRVAAPQKPSKPARLARRTADQIAKMVDDVVAVLTTEGRGLRAESIRKLLKMEARELPRILKQGVASKKLRILSGEKRTTTYGAVGDKPPRATKAKEAKPKAKEAKPKAKEAKPKAKEAKPKAKEAKPKAKEAKPKAKEAKPKAKEVKPKAKEAKPKAKEVKPKAKEAKPKAKEAKPKAKPGLAKTAVRPA
jgi:hypothetical protein